MKRIICLLMVVFMISALFIGCGQANEKDASDAADKDENTVVEDEDKDAENKQDEQKDKLEGKITFATNRTDKADTTITEMAKEFMEKHPGVEVTVEGLKDIEQILRTRMAANETPDVTPVLDNLLSEDFPQFFAPIDDLGFTEDNIYFYEHGLGPDGKLYTINSTVSYEGIIYNKNTFEKGGIKEIPGTIDEFYEVCEKLKSEGITPFASVYKDAWPLNWFTDGYRFAIASTGNPEYQNEIKDKEAILTDDGGFLRGFDLIREMNKKGYLEEDLMSAAWDSTGRKHAQGEIAMAFLGSWYPPQLIDQGANPEDIGMFPFPGTEVIPQFSDWFFAVAKNSENKDVAKAFLKWAWEEGKYASALGVLPPLKDAKINDPAVKQLLSFDMPVASSGIPDSVSTDILNKSEINLTGVLQEYIVTDDPEAVIEKVNTKWQKAREEVLND